MKYSIKLELVGQIESVLNKMCFAYDSDCHGCPVYTESEGCCELQKSIDMLYVLLGKNNYGGQNETLD